jgi:signal transduction histidine kinase
MWNFIWIVIGLSLMALAIILLVWMTWRRSRRNLYVLGLHNKELELAMESLEQRNRDYNHVVKVVAHDLRNPIGSIDGLSTLLSEEQHITPEGRHMLGLMRHSCDQVLRLIGQLLENQANPESNQMKMRLSGLNVLLTDCVSLLQFRAGEKKQQIRLGKIPQVLLFMDPDKMWRVFNNLIVNAIKFSPDRSVIRVFAKIAVQDGGAKGQECVICVMDQGIGIPAGMQDKVFDAFSGAGRAGTGGERSFGLGLSICRQIVEAQGGKIWLESEPGRGTTVFVSFPALTVEEEGTARSSFLSLS